MEIDASECLVCFLPNRLSCEANAWYIANRSPSDHKIAENLVGVSTREVSEPMMSAICKLAASLSFLASTKRTVVYIRL